MAKIEIEDRNVVRNLFAQNKRHRVIIDAAFDHGFGTFYADSETAPEVAMLQIGVFTQFGGDLKHPGLRDLLDGVFKTVIIPETDAWYDAISAIVGTGKRVPDRWGFSHDDLDIDHVRALSQKIPDGYEIRPMHGDKDMMQKAGGGTAFVSMEELMTYGIGFGVVFGDDVVGQALAWTQSKKGVEIQIGTNEAHRRKGLATLTGATLIFYCLENGIEPHWNAANAESAGLAEKLGYVQNDFYHPIPLFP